jgi:hypothetical protein
MKLAFDLQSGQHKEDYLKVVLYLGLVMLLKRD